MPTGKEMPDTLKRSPAKARRTWAKAHDSAVETYGEGERAHRTAYAAVKHLYDRAKQLGVGGRSKMTKTELAEAIARKQG